MSSSQRDEIRGKVFAAHKLATEEIEIFNTKIELRQPTLSDVLVIQQARDDSEDGSVPVSAVAKVLIQYSFVPKTNEKIFEEGDGEAIMQLPFGDDMIRVTDALERLTKVNFTPKTDTSEVDQTSTS